MNCLEDFRYWQIKGSFQKMSLITSLMKKLKEFRNQWDITFIYLKVLGNSFMEVQTGNTGAVRSKIFCLKISFRFTERL